MTPPRSSTHPISQSRPPLLYHAAKSETIGLMSMEATWKVRCRTTRHSTHRTIRGYGSTHSTRAIARSITAFRDLRASSPKSRSGKGKGASLVRELFMAVYYRGLCCVLSFKCLIRSSLRRGVPLFPRWMESRGQKGIHPQEEIMQD